MSLLTFFSQFQILWTHFWNSWIEWSRHSHVMVKILECSFIHSLFDFVFLQDELFCFIQLISRIHQPAQWNHLQVLGACLLLRHWALFYAVQSSFSVVWQSLHCPWVTLAIFFSYLAREVILPTRVTPLVEVACYGWLWLNLWRFLTGEQYCRIIAKRVVVHDQGGWNLRKKWRSRIWIPLSVIIAQQSINQQSGVASIMGFETCMQKTSDLMML